MKNDSHTFPFQCPGCRAVGELPLVAGNTSCPQCGEHLWTVRRVGPASASSGLAPAERLPLLPGRPPLDTRGFWRVRLCVVLFRPLVVVWRVLRQRNKENRVNSILDRVRDCRQREELQRLLGRPLYGVTGEVSGAADPPDLIECYETEGCCVDLWFKNDRLVDVSGFVKPTVWDVALAGYRRRDVTTWPHR